MADYGLKYQCFFDPIGPISVTPVYTIEILEKDYVGGTTDVIGSGVPVLHQWQTDDPKAPIKGSSLSINLINQTGSLPLSSFFSTDDDQFKVRLLFGAQVLFEGFLVQDDCSEVLVDFTHEINLSANDNLGLLKDVTLDQAKIIYDLVTQTNDTWSLTAPHTLTLPAGIAAYVHPGDIIVIDSLIFDVTYHVTEATGGVDVIVSETVATGSPGGSDDIEVRRPRPFDDKVTLAFILEQCLWATGLELNTNVWGRIIEQNQNETTSFIDQTLIDPQTFLVNATMFMNCYEVLEWIMKTFKMSCFQALGSWQIMRWDELRYYTNTMLAYVYDTDFSMIDEISMDNVFTAGIGELTVAETGLLHKIMGPYQFVRETFNYQQPGRLLRNYDLQEIGALLNTSTTGSGPTLQTTNEYEAIWWVDSDLDVTASVFFIRVVLDNLGNEIDRYLVVKDDGVVSYQIEANAGDVLSYSYQWRTEDSQAGVVGYSVIVKLDDGVNTRFAREPGAPVTEPGWAMGPGWTSDILSGDNSNVWHSVDIQTEPIPFDGLIYVYLPVGDLAGGDNGTYYKDIRLQYTPFINQSTKIIGQTHQSEQAAGKQNEDEGIFIDDSPRNAIAGTLFLNSVTGVLQDRTTLWGHPYLTQALKLGEIITFEQLFWRRVPRTILEGSFKGLTNPPNHISMLSVFKYTFFPDLNLVPGTMEIDYRNNRFTGTLWEIWNDNEVDADLSSTYIFKYLYSTK